VTGALCVLAPDDQGCAVFISGVEWNQGPAVWYHLSRGPGLAISSLSESIPLILLKPLTGRLTWRDPIEPEALFRVRLPFRSTMRPSLKGLVTDLDA